MSLDKGSNVNKMAKCFVRARLAVKGGRQFSGWTKKKERRILAPSMILKFVVTL